MLLSSPSLTRPPIASTQVVTTFALIIGLAGLIEKSKFIDPKIRVMAFHWTPLEVVGDFMRERALEIIAAFPWEQAQTRAVVDPSR
jgi:hypothetical protein